MPKLKIISGEGAVKIFLFFGFEVASQRGSHIKLRRILLGGTKQTLTIPNHHELDKGTILVIYRQALRYIPEQDLVSHFYSK